MNQHGFSSFPYEFDADAGLLRQDSLALNTRTHKHSLFCVFCLNVYPRGDLPHSPLYPRHLRVVSKMAENDSAKPPSPPHPPRAGRQDAPIPDPHGAAVPGQCSNLFIGHFLKHKDHSTEFIGVPGILRGLTARPRNLAVEQVPPQAPLPAHEYAFLFDRELAPVLT